jgi:phage shock protein A
MRGASGEFGRRSFQRLEERVTDMEFEARTLRDVRRMGQELYRAGAGGSRAVEAELERLRRRLEQEGWKR